MIRAVHACTGRTQWCARLKGMTRSARPPRAVTALRSHSLQLKKNYSCRSRMHGSPRPPWCEPRSKMLYSIRAHISHWLQAREGQGPLQGARAGTFVTCIARSLAPTCLSRMRFFRWYRPLRQPLCEQAGKFVGGRPVIHALQCPQWNLLALL